MPKSIKKKKQKQSGNFSKGTDNRQQTHSAWFGNNNILLTIGAIIVIAGVILTLGLTGVINMPFQEPQGSKDTGNLKSPVPIVIDLNKKYTATIKTAKGDIVCELYAADAPVTVNSFVSLARKGFYNGVTFHRVIKNPPFVIQGGDPTGTGAGGPGYQFQDEINQHKNITGALSMANAGSNTNGSQFFICLAPQPHLDSKHTVFGQVVQGMDIVNKVEQGDKMIEVVIDEQ